LNVTGVELTGPMRDTRTDAQLGRLAQAQYGLVELGQIRDRGVTRKEVRARVDRASLRRVDAGVYATFGSPPTWEQKVLAACLAAGSSALASHRTAAAIWGLIELPQPVDIVVPYAKCPTPAGATLHRSTDLREIDAARHNGIPVTNPIRTAGDLGAVAPGLVTGAIEVGLYKNLFCLAGLWRLIDDLAKPGRRGLGVLRCALEERALGNEPTKSPLESMLAAIAVEAGLRFEYQHRVEVEGHRYVLDFAFPPQLVAVEVDGLEAHATGRALNRDLERQNRLVLAGWCLMRYTWKRLVRDRVGVRREILRALADRRTVDPSL
jgi:very-short-patch-repair endonuclease